MPPVSARARAGRGRRPLTEGRWMAGGRGAPGGGTAALPGGLWWRQAALFPREGLEWERAGPRGPAAVSPALPAGVGLGRPSPQAAAVRPWRRWKLFGRGLLMGFLVCVLAKGQKI